jgi:hypothetical protein
MADTGAIEQIANDLIEECQGDLDQSETADIQVASFNMNWTDGLFEKFKEQDIKAFGIVYRKDCEVDITQIINIYYDKTIEVAGAELHILIFERGKFKIMGSGDIE